MFNYRGVRLAKERRPRALSYGKKKTDTTRRSCGDDEDDGQNLELYARPQGDGTHKRGLHGIRCITDL